MTFGEILKQRLKPYYSYFHDFSYFIHVYSYSKSDEYIIYTKI